MKTILVIEDDGDINLTLESILSEAGYKVVVARNGEDALRELRRIPAPSLMLLDLAMPVMNGWDFIQNVRLDIALSSIPICVISATANIQAPSGIAAAFQKPLDLDLLLEAVRLHSR